MYLRYTIRKKDGKVHRYWRLVRSVRVGRRVVQQTVTHLGELDEQGRVAARALARKLIGTPEQARLFDDGSGQLTVPVRLKGIRIERSRQFGDVYMALALWRGTGLEDLCQRLLPIGKEQIPWAKMAAVLVAARFCEPSSELHIAEDWYRRTALADLLQLVHRFHESSQLCRIPPASQHVVWPKLGSAAGQHHGSGSEGGRDFDRSDRIGSTSVDCTIADGAGEPGGAGTDPAALSRRSIELRSRDGGWRDTPNRAALRGASEQIWDHGSAR